MKPFKIFSAALLIFAVAVNAQDIDSAKKAIDAEQYEKAKLILKTLVVSKPDSGKNFFVLGNLYLTQKLTDSAAIYFNRGIAAKTESQFNNIGLGQIELENGNLAEANANFNKATLSVRKRDFEEFLYIGRAFMNPVKPDYKSALLFLNKAFAIQPLDGQLLLSMGDAYYGDKNVNEAFSAYRNAFDADNSILRAKLQLGVITKGSKAFAEAKTAFDNILMTNPTYGPAYRELAETYYLWAINDKAKYVEYNKTAMEYYDKYLSLTDYSLDSRMRHADFLILTKDYKALELEAEAMKKLDKVNPRILRYLGYSAYENGNFDAAIKAISDFLVTPNAKIIGRDYLYLGLALTAKSLTSSTGPDTIVTNKVDKALFNSGVAQMKKGVELDPVMANEMNDIGKKFFDIKLYKEAAAIYEVALLNPNSRNYLFDNFYFGYATYFDNINKKNGEKPDFEALQKADLAFKNLLIARPTQQDAYLYRARINSILENVPNALEEMVKNYEQYIKVVTEKGTDEFKKAGVPQKFVEAYINIGVYYLKTDKVKAKESFEKALLIDPGNESAIANLKFVK